MTLGDALGIAGLTLALYQIFRTGRLTLATHRAIERTSKQLGVYTLLVLVPELSLIEHQLEVATDANKRDDVRRLLREWKLKASELRGLLRTEPLDTQDLSKLLQESIVLATQAKTNVDKGKELAGATARVRDACEKVCLASRATAAEIRSSPPHDGEQSSAVDDFRALYGFRRVERVEGNGSG
ncbi:hypothetical protein [Cellulomonas chengniuliangii]|uniref:hypothetical protein n=1 Tax=Cellulomonas chengniuliangii TaxID=2968084 RepID=UPI001D0EE797|nr:hypothetical protein [Cellulomonas chengniuliangii]MCC2318795.1 hypothetical protein [Cellulomonas chengniuliangii]